RLSVGESRIMTNGGDPERRASHFAVRGETARDVEFVANLVNQSDRRVTAFMVEIENPSYWANQPFNTMSNPITNSGNATGQASPQESFKFKTRALPLQEKKDDRDLMGYLNDFKIRITGVKFESDEYWLMAQPGKTPGTYRGIMNFHFSQDAAAGE